MTLSPVVAAIPGVRALMPALTPKKRDVGRFPHGECGLDVIALIGAWRFREHRRVPEMHQRLQARKLVTSEQAVTHLLHRSDELVSLHSTDRERIAALLQEQGHVVLALDG
ncbi:MAG TPA: hypothetical protein VGF67_32515 [Ktedonobacteraceae bacterium]